LDCPHLSPQLSPFESTVCEKRPIDLCDIRKGSIVIALRSPSSLPQRAIVSEDHPGIKLVFDGDRKARSSSIQYILEVLQK
jgi:hypothetical protein